MMKRTVVAFAVVVALVLQGGVNVLTAGPASAATLPAATAYECYVRALYRDVLGPDRQVSDEEVDSWVARLLAGESYAQIAKEFVRSDESLDRIITGAYQLVLGEDPTEAQLAQRKAVLTDPYGNGHWSRTDLLVSLVLLPEFLQRYDERGWVQELYRIFFGHPASEQALEDWLGALRSHGPAVVATWVANEGEYLKRILQQHYQSLLGRTEPVSDEDLAPWVARLADPPQDLSQNKEFMAYAEQVGGDLLVSWILANLATALLGLPAQLLLLGIPDLVKTAETLIRLAGHPLHDMDMTVEFLASEEYVIRNTTDSTAPNSAVALAGTAGTGGWYRSDVTVTLSASDTAAGCCSGVQSVQYAIGGGSWQAYSTPVVLSGEGVTALTYRAIDVAGNVESAQTVQVKIDKTAPTIAGAPTTQPNAHGWYGQDVTVAFTASDAVSGLASVTPDQVITTEGADLSVVGTAVDQAGNSATATVGGINLDKSAPTVDILSPAPGPIANTADPTADWTATDALSGVAEAAGTYDGAPIAVGDTVDLTLQPAGSSHEVLVQATDRAGNTGSASVLFSVTVDEAGVAGAVEQLCEEGSISSEGLCSGLDRLTAAVVSAIARGSTTAAANQLEALMRLVDAQDGKKLTAEAADLLPTHVRYVLESLG